MARKKWTVMIYMYAGGNLRGVSSLFGKQLSRITGSTDVEIMVQAYKEWNTSPSVFSKRACRFRTGNSGNIKLEYGSKVEDVGNVDMGKAKTLSDFLQWCREKSAADNYMLMIWNHGGGFFLFNTDRDRMLFLLADKEKRDRLTELFELPEGEHIQDSPFLFDTTEDDRNENIYLRGMGLATDLQTLNLPIEKPEKSNFFSIENDNEPNVYQRGLLIEKKEQDKLVPLLFNPRVPPNDPDKTGMLRIDEIKKAIDTAFGNNKIQIIQFQACFMQMVETAYELKDSCEYIVGSEDYMYFTALEKMDTFNELVQDPTMDAKKFSARLVRDYPNYHPADEDPLLTISSLNGSNLGPLSDKIRDLANHFIIHKDNLRQVVLRARNKCAHFSRGYNMHNIDFVWFLKNLEVLLDSGTLKSMIRDLILFCEKEVIVDFFAGEARTGNMAKPTSYGSNGFTIFFPREPIFLTKFDYAYFYNEGDPFSLQFIHKNKWDEFLISYGLLKLDNAG